MNRANKIHWNASRDNKVHWNASRDNKVHWNASRENKVHWNASRDNKIRLYLHSIRGASLLNTLYVIRKERKKFEIIILDAGFGTKKPHQYQCHMAASCAHTTYQLPSRILLSLLTFQWTDFVVSACIPMDFDFVVSAHIPVD